MGEKSRGEERRKGESKGGSELLIIGERKRQ
jgi:hypothetical protein